MLIYLQIMSVAYIDPQLQVRIPSNYEVLRSEPLLLGSVADFVKQNPHKLGTQDMKYGGTPLHWCSSRETLQALIERGCDINALNFDGRTALHIMVYL